MAVVDVVWARPLWTARTAGWLDPREREQLARLQRASDRARYVAGHALLRLVVARRWDVDPSSVGVTATCARCGGQHGRPAVTRPPGRQPLHVSIAHAGDRVVVAVTDLGPVGVDVEDGSSSPFDGFDDVALAESERRAVAQLSPAGRLTGRTRMWVRKEAVLKATGDGLSVDPRRVVVSPPSARPRLLAWRGGSAQPGFVHLTDLQLGAGYPGCVALLGPRPAVVRLRSAAAAAGQPATA